MFAERRRRPIFGAAGIIGGVVPTLNTLVANRLQGNTLNVATTQPSTWLREHYAHPSGAITAIQSVDINRYMSSTTVHSSGAAHDIQRTIEYPAGVFWFFTWSGSTTVNIGAGATVTSDPIEGLTIPAGAKFWERTVYLTTGTFPVIELPGTPSALGITDGSTSGNLVDNGTISPGSSINTRGANILKGTVQANNARAFFILGDSLTGGTADVTSTGPKGGSGVPARILDQTGLPYFKFWKGGMQVAEEVTIAATINAYAGNFDFSDLFFQSGLNDLSLGSRTKAQVEADIQTMLGQAPFVGKHTYKTTVGPRSTSTDGWVTTTNQTAAVDGNMADLNGLNADIRAGLANVDVVIDWADAAMSARDSDIHKAPPAGTSDGTHYNSTRAALIAGLLSI